MAVRRIEKVPRKCRVPPKHWLVTAAVLMALIVANGVFFVVWTLDHPSRPSPTSKTTKFFASSAPTISPSSTSAANTAPGRTSPTTPTTQNTSVSKQTTKFIRSSTSMPISLTSTSSSETKRLPSSTNASTTIATSSTNSTTPPKNTPPTTSATTTPTTSITSSTSTPTTPTTTLTTTTTTTPSTTITTSTPTSTSTPTTTTSTAPPTTTTPTTTTTTTTTVPSTTTTAPRPCVTCADLSKQLHPDGPYTLQLWDDVANTLVPVTAYCRDGFTVIMQRIDGSVSFARNWADYKNGFGDVAASGNFWIGNDAIHLISTNCGVQTLRVDMSTCDGRSAYETYSRFKIGAESSNYTASVGGAAGTAGDGLNNGYQSGSGDTEHMDGMQFTTIDSDHDQYLGNCAFKAMFGGGGWWYNSCDVSQPTGQYKPSCPAHNGIYNDMYWWGWPGPDFDGSSSLSSISMSMAPASAANPH